MPTIMPMRGPRRPALPTPTVQQAVVRQTVDLKPAGATVAVTTPSSNPFEDTADVTVVTQASGGVAQAPPSMQSRGFLHRSFLPGMSGLGNLGDDEKEAEAEATEEEAKSPSTTQVLTSALDTTGKMMLTREQRKLAEEQAKVERAKAGYLSTQGEARVLGIQRSMLMWGVVGILGVGGLLAVLAMTRKK